MTQALAQILQCFIHMRLHGALTDAEDLSDLCILHVVEITEDEDLTTFLGQLVKPA